MNHRTFLRGLWESGGPERGAPVRVETPAERHEREVAACRAENCEECRAGVPLLPESWDRIEGHEVERTRVDRLGCAVRYRTRVECAAWARVMELKIRSAYGTR